MPLNNVSILKIWYATDSTNLAQIKHRSFTRLHPHRRFCTRELAVEERDFEHGIVPANAPIF